MQSGKKCIKEVYNQNDRSPRRSPSLEITLSPSHNSGEGAQNQTFTTYQAVSEADP